MGLSTLHAAAGFALLLAGSFAAGGPIVLPGSEWKISIGAHEETFPFSESARRKLVDEDGAVHVRNGVHFGGGRQHSMISYMRGLASYGENVSTSGVLHFELDRPLLFDAVYALRILPSAGDDYTFTLALDDQSYSLDDTTLVSSSYWSGYENRVLNLTGELGPGQHTLAWEGINMGPANAWSTLVFHLQIPETATWVLSAIAIAAFAAWRASPLTWQTTTSVQPGAKGR